MQTGPDFFTLDLAGKITTIKECQKTFETAHQLVMQGVSYIEMNFAQVTELSGSFAGFLTTLVNKVRGFGGELRISNANDHVRSILLATGFAGLVKELRDGTKKNTVLLIEDDIAVRNLTREYFKELNYLCIEAENGCAGIELYRRYKQSILFIVLDINMPVMDGEEVFNALLDDDPEARIIVVTGYADSDKLIRIKQKRDLEILKKPFFLRDMEDAIKRTLQRKIPHSRA
ncbi:MAG: hypothetical protein A2268_08215 [Candidatus Raymondbacteria bacterium RifOxyA12_full_50_37]|uniref:Response regulatory domain-containing protein n=1 Tax=Candidatus Raymondbacteria bacterium RIFOXYD12_FULL_49_13 TaxID=1817890 RepID=A0A1F7FD02_UNCRA|nr:MAG: hypothetical protein A2268_08215 [Candidatus Raymondbacteria bacterium RifOxyA12_full_50_37]OGJ93551.1 MAG: hypothetical protein A2248_09260 [Candidatus Raymondbacteria bacterium RIFOXYA2_FULL_49_16]OGJ98821.1 MAG: hypothetical protein A2453_10070 [Candidatus Raymondbacteria bacterium RIFOXYC2_FULL_50_21]OGK02446.1 MAG: hypothetical protein A2350_11570 [Candidatus Raymondbacteria bacterium RifOxyB12_full_50_8]OGK04565.1 MAG: hypothetical protein A2519_19775 [Candidatus Raymondbacteria b